MKIILVALVITGALFLAFSRIHSDDYGYSDYSPDQTHRYTCETCVADNAYSYDTDR